MPSNRHQLTEPAEHSLSMWVVRMRLGCCSEISDDEYGDHVSWAELPRNVSFRIFGELPLREERDYILTAGHTTARRREEEAVRIEALLEEEEGIEAWAVMTIGGES